VVIAQYSEFTARDSGDRIEIQDKWYQRRQDVCPVKAPASSRHQSRQGSLLVEVAALP
jgi:hypothetical protein